MKITLLLIIIAVALAGMSIGLGHWPITTAGEDR